MQRTTPAIGLATLLLLAPSNVRADCDAPLATCSPASGSAEINPVQDCAVQSGGDDTDLIQAAINIGLAVRLPAGIFSVDAKPGETTVICLKSGTTLRGAGIGATVLQLGSRGGHMLDGGASEDVTVRDLTLIGSRGAQVVSGTHGIRFHDATRVRIEDVSIHDTDFYGIGLQSLQSEGAHDNVVIRGVLIEDTGSDGIDIKNSDSENRSIVIADTTVVRPGRDDPTDAAIDVRGPVTLSNIHVHGLDGARRGIRFRHGEESNDNGLGADQASLTNFWIRSDPGSTTIGLAVVARNVKISNGNIEGGARGITVVWPCVEVSVENGCDPRSNTLISNVVVQGVSQIGFVFDDTVDTIRCVNCSSLDNGTEGFRIEGANVFLTSFNANGNSTYGARIMGTASGALLLGGDVRGNGTPIAFAPADTRIRDVRGFCQSGDPDCP